MGKLLTSKAFVNENIFKFEKRLESQYTIFLDKTPTFVTYYHINNVSSTVDNGFLNVEKIIGSESPIRFQKIEDFPIYGIETIKLDLSDEEEGLTSSFDSEGIILPNTIKPLPNDFFMISYLGKDYMFMINAIDYDTIKSNNFYKVNFQIRGVTPTTVETVEGQVLEKYTCIFDNIGTDDKCLLREDEFEKLKLLRAIYTATVNKYKRFFYSSKFNSFMYNDIGGDYIYDKYMTHFANSNGLFVSENTYDSLYLSNEDHNDRFIPEYDNCFYAALERRNVEELEPFRVMISFISDENSVFKYYHADKMKSVMFIETGLEEYIPDVVIESIKLNLSDGENFTIIEQLLVKYFNDTIESVYGLDLDAIKNYRIQYNFHDFIYIPILLYILRFYGDKFMSVE